MGTFGSAALHLQDDDEDSDEENKEKRLPPLLEDEENVSLADILCLRDDGLTEQELWAVCVECVCSLQSISLSPLYHTLCITPDTLAFNAHGNVCFMEQMNDDPDGCFIPPEFDKTGNTFEGHMFSLGSSLSAALNYITDVELELSPGSTRLLKQMQMEKPEDRPRLQDVMSQAEVVLGNVSPASVCRSLSAIGRRVLSIESVAAFQDGWEKSAQQFAEHKISRSNSVENPSADGVMIRNFSCDSCDGSGGSSDSRSQNSSPVHRRSQGRRSGRPRRALNRSCSVPDSNNPPAFSPHAPISMMMADLSDITEEESAATGWNGRLHRVALKKEVKTSDSEREESETADHTPEPPDTQQTHHAGDEETREDADRRAGSNHMSRSMMCLNVEFQNTEWMSLPDVLSQSSQPFSVNELWALCHMCLTTLQTYTDLPDYLCLDSVYVTREGEMLFMRPKNKASCDVFFMAPEFQAHGIVTEKACVYGVAAILWTTAKFHLSPNQKLAMPRKLKRLLLEMARKTPVERPSIETVKKCCRDYLARQGTDAEMVWTELIRRLQQALVGCRDQTSSPECAENTSDPHLGEDQTGFVSLVSEGRMAPVTGPVPHHNITLPEAFTSPATHFSPIVLTPNTLEADHQSERSVFTQRLTDSVTQCPDISDSDHQSCSDAVERASVSLQCYSSEGCDQCSPLPSSPPSAPEENLQEIKTQLKIKPRRAVHESEPDETVFGIRREDTQEVMSQAPLYDSKEVSEQGSCALLEMQFSIDPEGGTGECVPETEPLWHRSELEEGGGAGLTPDCLQAHMDDSDSLISDRTLSGSTDPRDPPHDPAWALALYGEDSFSQDVLNYAQKLCSHCESPSLEDKSQELQQQLLIESRNLKKTRNFLHKLIHQERRNKGSDTKLMMSKVKLQFDELRDKVQFLQSVKKYLQVLRVDQWGLSLSLLPALAVCGYSSSVLQSSDDPAVLSSVRGKHGPLVTASAAALMAYLYARKAHIEGYIRQFFYTFRYFCTPEELLEFLMDKYNSTLRATEDQTSDCVRVHQRTVDLLHMWMEDALSLDFSCSSRLLQTLESFLTSKVAPVHSRGERLLSMLQATPRKRRVCGLSCAGDASISRSEYEDVNSLCRKSRIEDAARQILHRRVSRVPEPQTDQTFSIAAALPRPCYVSFMRSDETPTFSQTEHAALHTAQQLTLLEQKMNRMTILKYFLHK
ncbi:kinase non-catalytic C-lobe domain-containing protein 1-like isoform X2 [Triplophysa rosa]|uniref:kinase non-catalytic C-lobe domain-containing protein 1-like isoform X2 n=1 Tax=Triplophysa rosa TaxID=992332 RepID=UPI002545BFB0|nr:kinase non-catalytic C-lobe domain-containing protein 1-like isoform X2 [Triplophysa rosa]